MTDPPDDTGGGTTQSARGSEGPGALIGPYRLLQQIGEGGFGTVFMAEQSAAGRRRVALKIIKLGMDTKQVVARFEAGAPGAGADGPSAHRPRLRRRRDAGGRPYFVMELVKGEPITAYCDAHNLSIRDRLELFAQVCHGRAARARKGVIHRDLKPSEHARRHAGRQAGRRR